MMKHKIFGVKENVKYLDRVGAYLILFQNNKVGVVKTPKGYFLLGGGLEKGEHDTDCIERECLEEIGFSVYVEDKICSAETYMKHPAIGYFHPIQTYYFGELLEKVSAFTETNHILCFIEYEQIKENMFLEMQNWALEQAYESMSNK